MGTLPRADRPDITSSGFSRLLRRLDPDPDRAGAEYERLRAALERFFDWRGAWPPEECADETLDRLARKLDEDVSIDEVRGYARGIARLVLLEWQRRPAMVSVGDAGTLDALAAPPPIAEADDETLRPCFERCLASLPEESRVLVVEYYVAERRAKIENRQHLARTLGLSESALRNRVQRVRDRLERCVRTCTNAAASVGIEQACRDVSR